MEQSHSREAPTEPSHTGRIEAPVYTYHCLCKQLVLASTQPLTSLPIRASSIERPYVLHLPDQLPSKEDSDAEESKAEADQNPSDSNEKSLQRSRQTQHFALLFRTAAASKAQIVRKSAGFEKRYLRCCARCNTPIGYQLDWCMFPDEEGQWVTESNGQQRKKAGRRMDYIYLFPGGVIDTSTMDETCDGGTPIGRLRTKEITEE